MSDLEKANDLLRRFVEWPREDGYYFDIKADADAYLATQPEPVDPDLIAAREIVAAAYELDNADNSEHAKSWAGYCRDGSYDTGSPVRNTLAGIKHGRGK